LHMDWVMLGSTLACQALQMLFMGAGCEVKRCEATPHLTRWCDTRFEPMRQWYVPILGIEPNYIRCPDADRPVIGVVLNGRQHDNLERADVCCPLQRQSRQEWRLAS
jgi:hypothetical protein